MHEAIIDFLALVLSNILHYFSQIDNGFFDLIRIFAGSIGWIGGLTLFMWWKEHRKKVASTPVPAEP